MTALGFDTALAVTSACVVRSNGEAYCTPPPPPARLFEPPAHSQELLPEIERLVVESRSDWQSIESIAVGVGPGTFTGLRIGVATARALGQALDVGLRPVSSLDALAAGIAAGAGELAGRPLLALIDARRRQVFAALYRGEGSVLERLWPAAVLDPQDLLERMRALDRPPVCAGDWAIKSRAELEEGGATVPAPDSGLHAVSAWHVCKLGASVEPVAPERVQPTYLRLPDAEISRRLARGNLD